MKFVRQFREFLKQSVNIDQTRLDQLDEHTNAIEDYLADHDVFDDLVVQTIPQGSWAHQTIIRPQDGKEFDADLLLELSSQSEWEPRDYLSALRRAFRDSDLYKGKVARKNRCVRIVYAGDCHVDVVPFVRDTGDLGIGAVEGGLDIHGHMVQYVQGEQVLQHCGSGPVGVELYGQALFPEDADEIE